jgi:chaperonin GroES
VKQLEPINKSGIEPCGNKVLVKPDSLEEFTDGGIYLPEQVKERHELSACYGYVVAVGPDCFKHTVSTVERLIEGSWKIVERTTVGYSGEWARPGDRIAFAIYAGLESTGEDGEKYKTINDEDITARVSSHVTQTSIEPRKPFSAE